MSRVASPTLAGILALVALASCSGNDSPTAPVTNTPPVNVAPPSAALLQTPTDDNILLATTDAPDTIGYQSPDTVRMSLASQIGGTGGLDIMTLMDASGSLGRVGWAQEKDFVSSLIGTNFPNPPDGRTRMGIIEFSGSLENVWHFTDNQTPTTMINVVNNLSWLASYTWTKSAVVDAINQFGNLGDPTHGRLMLLITDGVPYPTTENPCTPGSPIPGYLAQYGIHTVIVGVGTQWNPTVLSCLVQDPATDIIQVSDFSALGNVLGQISTYVNPAISNVHLTGTVSPDFDVTSPPVKTDTVLINGTDPSTPTYDSSTRTLSWTLNPVDRRVRSIAMELTPSASASPPCGNRRTAISNLQVAYTDTTGNAQTKVLPDIVMDVTGCPAPVITPTVTGTQGTNGWYTSDVGVHFDIQSVETVTGKTGCDDASVTSDTDSTSFICSATSAAGTTVDTVTVRRDATPPVIAFTGNANTYVYGENIDIACSVTDATSGLASSTCPEVHAAASTFTLGEHTLDATATDSAGNNATAHASFKVVQDTTPPVIVPTVTGPAGDNGWYVGDVSVSWSVSDPESAVSAQTGCDSQTVSTDTDSTSFICSATSAGGTDADTVTVKRDATPPTVAYLGNAGTYGASQDVSIQCQATDAMSGVASSTCADVSEPAWQLGVGMHTYSATATDNAGNSGSGSTSFTVTVSTSDLVALVNAWVSGPGAHGVKNSLIVKLTGKHSSVNAFINEVEAQSGKKIPADKAAILISLAQSL